MKSKRYYSLPAVIAGKEVIIKTDLEESDIPLLLSRTAMKEDAIKLDLKNDTAVTHYCILIDKSEEVLVENICAVKLEIQI